MVKKGHSWHYWLSIRASNSEFHGPLWLYNSQGLRRLFWFLVCIGGFLSCALNCFTTVDQYLTEPTTYYEIVSAEELLLPEFGLSLPTRFSRRKANLAEIPEELLGDLHYAFATSFIVSWIELDANDFFVNLGLFQRSVQFKNFLESSRFENMSDLMNGLHHDCEDIIVDGHLKGRYLNQTQCCELVKPGVGGYGRTFYLQRVKQREMGRGQALALRLKPPVDDYVYSEIQYPYDGIMVSLESEAGFHSIYASRGGRTNVRLRATEGHYIPTSSNLCKSYPFKGFSTPWNCKMSCIDKTLYNCHCRPFDTRLDDKDHVCQPAEGLECLVKGFSHWEKGNSETELKAFSELMAACNGQCPQSCEVITYDISTDYVPFAAQYNASLGPEHIVLDLHFESTQKTVIRQERASVASLLATMGGLVGLWVGGSVIAIVQALLVCVTDLYPKKKR